MQDSVEKQQKRLVKFLYLLFFAIVLGSVIFISRSPHISNTLKKLILPELETASGHKVIAKKIYINILPFFVEAKDLKIFDDEGNRIFLSKRVKGYLEPSGLLKKHLSIRRLVIKEPMVTADSKKIDEIIRNIKMYIEKEEKKPPLRVKIKVVEVNEGSAYLRDEDFKSLMNIQGLGCELILDRDPKLDIYIKKFEFEKEGLTKLMGNINASLVFRKKEIEIKKLDIGSYDSALRITGVYPKGSFKTEIKLLVSSLKRILNLKERDEGRISAKGEIRLEGLQPSALPQHWKDIFIDLKLQGDFYIQTLMEVLKVKEKIEGLVEFHGEIKGKLSDISGSAKARLQRGNLFGVNVDTLRCDVTYQDGLMRFENGDAELYGGNAKTEASIHIPVVEPYTVKVKFDSIDSRAAFKLIGWEPDIPEGKVDGELVTSGSDFNPGGWFVYEAYKPSTAEVLGRIKGIKGSYSRQGDILALSGLQLGTSLSHLQLDGTVEMAKKTLHMKANLNTKDVSDLTLPYFTGLKGQGNFSGEITGSLNDPEISGTINISDAYLEGYRANRITSRISYTKNLLNIRELLIMKPGEDHRLKGKISFPDAKEPFEFSGPVYEMDAIIKNADLRELMQIYFKGLPIQGELNADFKIGGKGKDVKVAGNSSINRAEIYHVPVDSAYTAFSYVNREISLKQAIIRCGTSTLKGEGKFSLDKNFSFNASGDKILTKDLGLKYFPENSSLSFRSKGQGTFDNPEVTFTGEINGGTSEGRPLGKGIIDGEIKNRNVLLKVSLFDEKVKLNGKGYLKEDFPWTAGIEIQPERYDFLFAPIVKDIPEDMILTLGGRVDMKGNMKNVSASATINPLNLTFSGYNFSNDSDISVQVRNRNLSFSSFTVRSGSSSLLRLRGDLEFGRGYNLFVEGRSSLAPFEKVFKKVGHIAGDANFSFSIIGKWEKPDMHGELNVSNASFGLKDYPQRISSITGFISLDEDRIIVKKFSGKMGGGDIDVSGVLYHEAFGIKRFYLEANLNDITVQPIKDLTINFKGNLLYKGKEDYQGISGDIKIKGANYKKNVEWTKFAFLSKTKEIPRADVSRFDKTGLNVRISGKDNIYIKNNVARAPAMLDIVLRGTISHPILFGRIESKEGFVYFRNNEFKIIHASADFADPYRINPFIELRAETNVSTYDINLSLEGQLAQFSLSLSSDPPLEEMDILSLLTTGKFGKETKGIEGGIGTGQAASFLTGGLQEEVRTLIGLDRLQIDPYVSKTTGTVGPRVTVSERLISDRLSVTYTTFLGSTEEQILKLEYLLGRNVSLIGVRDERGIVGGDIKFRFEFK